MRPASPHYFRQILSQYRFALSRGNGIPPHPHAFPPLLKACASLGLLPLGLGLHLHAIVLGYFPRDPYISSSLLHMYSQNGDLVSARRVFDQMPLPLRNTVVPWSAIIAAHSRAGDAAAAFSLYGQMRRFEIQPNSITLLALLLAAVLRLDHLQCVHASAIRHGFEADLVLANSMLNVYATCGRPDLARRLFDSMPLRDIVSWNSMLLGCARTDGCVTGSIDLFRRMRVVRGIHPDHQTYGSLISCFTNTKNGGEGEVLGKSVHALVVTSGVGLDAHVQTALVSMYLKFGRLSVAFLLFDQAQDHRDIVLWTAMISGLAQNNGADKALVVFSQMLSSGMTPATTTIASALSACAQLGLSSVGASIHGYVIRRRMPLDTAAQNSLMTMYAKCGHVRLCRCVFDMMQDRDLVSWNAVISGHAQSGHLAEAFVLFRRMRLARQRPDTITMVSLLQACASVGALHHGKSVHNFVIRHGPHLSISIDTSLVDMYSKCGNLEAARRCFVLMPQQDLVSWSAIISGYGNHGMGILALKMFEEFLGKGMRPNDVMFLAVLSACSHAGLVSEGLKIFNSMEEDYGVVPRLEHCACIIDMLCRAKKVKEALYFIKTMPSRCTPDVLGILLDACRTNGFVHLAEEVAREIVALRPESAGNYVQLANSYAAMRRWDGVGETWAQMRALGLKKAPGWSFIELNGTITTFFADHTSHTQHDEMVSLLKIIDSEMREISKSSMPKLYEISCWVQPRMDCPWKHMSSNQAESIMNMLLNANEINELKMFRF
ncbi:pentatricopeptide repeat-containing protein At4g04370 [Phoenix dactylifera]|uniref:Pentatricopeptide repeat-containing protein At4g04370 n=1 Tax=Phoenix dactylifera TaxID=42345 RepID=A0A8B7C3Z6_PHODC|nr:pentatricopeptide repeat-containing protein At4g04370 [Phoenix dactylifera]